jgi:MazG family protein
MKQNVRAGSNGKRSRKAGARNRALRVKASVKSGVKSRNTSTHVQVNKQDKLAGEWFAKLVALQARLRNPGGCPWDREQTHESLRKFLLEETYEVLDAMETGDPRNFSSELGDLLLQIVFHSNLAQELGEFTISDVIESVYTKMVRRHPHVFGNVKVKGSADVLKNWEQIKAAERAEADANDGKAQNGGKPSDSILGGVPRSLPAVLEAYQLTRRASRVGFDWDDVTGILEKIDEEKSELKSALEASEKSDMASTGNGKQPSKQIILKANARQIEEEVGDFLFAGINLARFLGIDPEIALKKANLKFKRRFHYMEDAAASENLRFADLPRKRMEELWNLSKAADAAARETSVAKVSGKP